jgi:hypothetical protein
MTGMSEELRRSCDLPRRLAVLFVVAAGLLPRAPALAVEPSDIESNLTITAGGTEQQVTLAEALTALNIPAVSFALIDQDRIAFARAYGEGATPGTLFQAASLSKFVAAVGADAPRRSEAPLTRCQRQCRTYVLESPGQWFRQGPRDHAARPLEHDGRDRRAGLPWL